jgi:hypothetical protein
MLGAERQRRDVGGRYGPDAGSARNAILHVTLNHVRYNLLLKSLNIKIIYFQLNYSIVLFYL